MSTRLFGCFDQLPTRLFGRRGRLLVLGSVLLNYLYIYSAALLTYLYVYMYAYLAGMLGFLHNYYTANLNLEGFVESEPLWVAPLTGALQSHTPRYEVAEALMRSHSSQAYYPERVDESPSITLPYFAPAPTSYNAGIHGAEDDTGEHIGVLSSSAVQGHLPALTGMISLQTGPRTPARIRTLSTQ